MKTLNDQSGIALVLALVMLMLLTMLGTFALNTASTEMFISSNYRNMQQAMFASDAAFEYAFKGTDIYSDPTLEGASWPLSGTGNSLKDPLKNYNTINIGDSTADVKVKFVKRGNMPGGGIRFPPSDNNDYEAVFYLISTSGSGRNNAVVDVEALTFRIVRKVN